MDELEEIFSSIRKKEERDRKFMAAINNIDLSDDEEAPDFEEIKRRAEARLSGMSDEEFSLASIGIGYSEG